MNGPRDRLIWLDSLRGVAILGVVLVHCGERPLSNLWLMHIANAGQYGVQLFFVISAITIGFTYTQHREKFGDDLRATSAWLVRRIFRIWPLYAIAAVLYSIEHHFLNVQLSGAYSPEVGWTDLLANLTFLHSWIPSAHSVVPGGWSIGVEANFYCLFPVLVIFREKKYFKSTLVLMAVFLLAVSEIANYALFGTLHVQNNSYYYFWPPTQLPVLLIGCVFFFGSWYPGSSIRTARVWPIALFFVAFSGLGLALGSWSDVSPALAPAVLAPAFCCLCLLAAADRHGIIANRWLSQLGVCSYSIYLVHFAVIDVVRLVLRELSLNHVTAGIALLAAIYVSVLSVSYLIAIWTHRFVEVPGIELGRRLSTKLLASARTSTAGHA